MLVTLISTFKAGEIYSRSRVAFFKIVIFGEVIPEFLFKISAYSLSIGDTVNQGIIGRAFREGECRRGFPQFVKSQ